MGICARPSLRSAPPGLPSRYICMLVHGRMHTCKHMRTYTQAHTPICVQLQAELDALCARARACAYPARTQLLQVGSKTSCKPRSAADATPSARTLRHAHKHARTHAQFDSVRVHVERAHTRSRNRTQVAEEQVDENPRGKTPVPEDEVENEEMVSERLGS